MPCALGWVHSVMKKHCTQNERLRLIAPLRPGRLRRHDEVMVLHLGLGDPAHGELVQQHHLALLELAQLALPRLEGVCRAVARDRQELLLDSLRRNLDRPLLVAFVDLCGAMARLIV